VAACSTQSLELIALAVSVSFVGAAGSLLDDVRNRTRLREKVRVAEHVAGHDVRHTSASPSLAARTNVPAVAERLVICHRKAPNLVGRGF